MKSSGAQPFFRVRRSKIHGTGIFAIRRIPKGTRIAEYIGERISHAEADRRYEHKDHDDNHTFLFTVDRRTVIDGGIGGNESRFINHSCDPNCETVIEGRRVYVETVRDIAKGVEIVYDYMIERETDDPPNRAEIFGCRCGAATCRGTMLLPHAKPAHAGEPKKRAGKQPPREPPKEKLFRVRRSKVHGTGVFAVRNIAKGTRVIEYVGERISHAEADRRHGDKELEDNHTFLFTVDSRTVIDAGTGGSAARFINHSCDANCETTVEQKRVFIDAARDIKKGEELGYDYMIERDPSDPPNIDVIFACRCGAKNCRGTMLLPPKKPRRRKTRNAKRASAKTRARATRKGRAPAKAAARKQRRAR